MFQRTSLAVLVFGACLAAAPLTVSFHAGILVTSPTAFAKDGSGDGGSGHGGGRSGSGSNSGSGSHSGSNSGSGSHSGSGSGRGGDNGGSGNGRGGNDDDGKGGSGRSSDDHGRNERGDDHGGRSRGADDATPQATATSGIRAVRFESSATGVEIVYSNGTREEIANGRFESKNAAGRTISERNATPADLARLRSNARNSGLAPAPAAPVPAAASRPIRVEAGGGAIEVTYDTGWKEELEAGRYELKDPNNNTVVQRAATPADNRRLQALVGG